MEIIDFHGHFFPDSLAERAVKTVAEMCGGEIVPALDGTLAELIRGMEQFGISQTINLPVATKPESVMPINSTLLLDNPKIISFGALSPFSSTWESDIDFLKKVGVKGVKLHPEYQGFYLNDPAYLPFYRKIADAGFITLFHAGFDPGPFSRDHALPEMFLELKQNVPNLTIVAGHFGGLLMWDDVEKYLIGTDIYFDTAAIADFLPQEQFVDMATRHGIDKVLFGSDTPWEDQGKAIRYIVESSLSESAKEQIFSINAKRLIHG